MKKILQYLKLPEVLLFWIYFALFIVYILVSAVFIPESFSWLVVLILAGLGAVILINSFRLAKMNLEIKIERNELSSIIYNLNDGLIAYDPEFKILIFNRAAEAIFEIPAKEMIGKVLTPDKAKTQGLSLLCQTVFPSLAPLVVKKSEPGAYPQISDLIFENPRLFLRVTTGRITDPSGNLLGFVKIIKDRTREVEMLKSKNTFIEVAAHELRTPLTGVSWIFEALSKEKLNAQQKELVDNGVGAARRALQTVNDLLDVAKIEEGKFDYHFEPVDIVGFLENILAEMMPMAQKAGIKVYFQKPDKIFTAFIDQQKFSVAFSNIVGNAIKYNVENGEVFAEIKKMEGRPYFEISVRDTGIGIPADQINGIFSKFFRADNAKKSATEGIGLGLNITKNIIKRHGGEIWAESVLNRGTTFHLTLPADEHLVPSKEILLSDEEELL